MRENITNILDALGLLTVAGGVGAGLFALIGWWSIAVAGILLLAGSTTATILSERGAGE